MMLTMMMMTMIPRSYLIGRLFQEKRLIISSKKIIEHTTYTCKTCKKDMDGSCFLINLNRVMYALIKQEDIDKVIRIPSMNIKTIIMI